jgi:acid phosphatase family membrane protein YuiD
MWELHDIYFFVPVIVWISAQVSKMVIDSYYWNRLRFRSLWSSWGMPSAHSTLTSSLLVMVMLLEWIFSTFSMIVTVFALLIWYDAANVRYESWKHAQYINSLRSDMHKVMTHDHIPDKSFFSWFSLLRERLWHTPTEICIWIIFWVIVTLWIVYLIDNYIITF